MAEAVVNVHPWALRILISLVVGGVVQVVTVVWWAATDHNRIVALYDKVEVINNDRELARDVMFTRAEWLQERETARIVREQERRYWELRVSRIEEALNGLDKKWLTE